LAWRGISTCSDDSLRMEYLMKVGDLVKRKIFSPALVVDNDLFIILKVVRQGVRESGKLWKVGEPSGQQPKPLIELKYFEQV